jgi:hypothetical protein
MIPGWKSERNERTLDTRLEKGSKICPFDFDLRRASSVNGVRVRRAGREIHRYP